MLPRREISRFGRQEWSSKHYTVGKNPTHCFWLAGSSQWHERATPSFLVIPHYTSQSSGPGVWVQPEHERQQLLQVTYVVGVRRIQNQANYACGFPIFPEDYNLFLQVSVCSWFSSLHRLKMAHFTEFNSGLLISKNRDHSTSETAAVTRVILSTDYSHSELDFPYFFHNSVRYQAYCKLCIVCYLPDPNKYRHEMKRVHFFYLTKSLILNFLLVKYTSKMNSRTHLSAIYSAYISNGKNCIGEKIIKIIQVVFPFLVQGP